MLHVEVFTYGRKDVWHLNNYTHHIDTIKVPILFHNFKPSPIINKFFVSYRSMRRYPTFFSYQFFESNFYHHFAVIEYSFCLTWSIKNKTKIQVTRCLFSTKALVYFNEMYILNATFIFVYCNTSSRINTCNAMLDSTCSSIS